VRALPWRGLVRRQRERVDTDAETTLVTVYPVGRYGLTPEWGDGHDTGIYTFKALRQAAGLA